MAFRARMLVAVSAGVLGAALTAGPAFAHVEVEADKTQAGARDVTLTFNGEAESATAGIRSERIVLPAGVAPGDVSLVKAPRGWKFTAAADGFTLAGPALKIGQDAVFAVRLAQVPADASSLSFKTLETYGDGEIVRWIDLPQAGEPEPDHPAPTIKLKGAVKPAATTPSASPSAAVTPSEATTATPSETAAVVQAEVPDSGSSHTGWWVALAVVVIAAAAGLLIWRRRSGGSTVKNP